MDFDRIERELAIILADRRIDREVDDALLDGDPIAAARVLTAHLRARIPTSPERPAAVAPSGQAGHGEGVSIERLAALAGWTP